MKKFIRACKFAREFHGVMWNCFTLMTRRNIVRYWYEEKFVLSQDKLNV